MGFEAVVRSTRSRDGPNGVQGQSPWPFSMITRRLEWLALLTLPAAWFGVFYLAALVALFVSAFWQVDSLSGEILHVWTLDNFRQLLGEPTYRHVAARTVLLAAAVTVTDAMLAWPFALYMVRHAGVRVRAALMAAVTVPLWCSYLARVYAWRLILSHDGALNWALHLLHLPDQHIAYSNWAIWLVFSYLWLPFMILPVAASLERISPSLLEASADLGASELTTLRRVLLPLAVPGLVAGSIFTFSLTLGDFITPMLVGGAGSDFIGNVVYASVGVANNVPFAAAFAVLPLLVMAGYLLLARRLGAFEAL
jgi:putative spermidine/putrescine transport system permease protein